MYTFLFPSSAFKHAIIGVNIGKNKDSTSMEESLADYEGGVSAFGELADYLAINISSPNTPGLRALQRQAELTKLIQRAKETRDNLNISVRCTISRMMAVCNVSLRGNLLFW